MHLIEQTSHAHRDIVCHRGNFLFLYARTGKPVVLTNSGDVLCRPTVLERRVYVGGSSLEDHLASRYERAMVRLRFFAFP